MSLVRASRPLIACIVLALGLGWAAVRVQADRTTSGRVMTDLEPEEITSFGSETDMYISYAPRSKEVIALTHDRSTGYAMMGIDVSTHETRSIDFDLKSDAYVGGVSTYADADSRGRNWFATVDSLAFYDPATGKVTEVEVPFVTKVLKTDHPMPIEFPWEEQSITGMMVDDDDRVWISRSETTALLLLDPRTGRWAEVDGPVEDESVGPIEGSGPFIFAGTTSLADPSRNDTRVYRLNTKTGSWKALARPGGWVGSSAPGRLEWVRRDGSLVSLDASTTQATSFRGRAGLDPLNFTRVNRKGDVWVQPDATSLRREGKDGNKVWVFPADIVEFSTGAGAATPYLASTAFDDDGNLWAVVYRSDSHRLVKFER